MNFLRIGHVFSWTTLMLWGFWIAITSPHRSN